MFGKVFVLIFYIGSGHGGGPATLEFQTLGECEAMGRQIEAHFETFTRKVTYVCVESVGV